MKAGVATNLFIMRALQELDISLRGDVLFESVVDEEFGGVNGTLAGRLRGDNADAAIISEPSFLRICPAQRGGRTAHVTLSVPPGGGILGDNGYSAGISDAVGHFLSRVPQFAEQRRRSAPPHEMYSRNPVPVAVTKISTGPWGTGEPVASPEVCRIEMFWQAVPGEALQCVDDQFRTWLDTVVVDMPQLYPEPPRVEFPIRWLPGSAIDAGEPLVREFEAAAAEVLNRKLVIEGIEGPCDMFVFHEFGIPAILWGARGGNTHNADEYVEIDTVVQAAAVLLAFVCRWCEVKE
jgi:acetylornithine deacetylase